MEKAQADKAKSVGSLLPGMMASLKLEQRRSDREIIMAWNSLMDPNVVTHAQPKMLTKEGTLMVTVDSNVWLHEIVRWRRHEILDRLQSAFGPDKIKKISFRID